MPFQPLPFPPAAPDPAAPDPASPDPAAPDAAPSGADVPTAVGGQDFRTVAEVAELMRVSKMTVYRLVHGGELPAVRVGRSFRVRAAAVHRYLENAYYDAG